MNVTEFLGSLQDYGNAIIAILTLVLTIATGFYAWVSYRLLHESVEARRSAVRPLLSLTLDSHAHRTQVKYEEGGDANDQRARISIELKLANYGRGPALALEGRCRRPGIPGFCVVRVPPGDLSPLAQLEATTEPELAAELTEGATIDYILEFSYQDIEGNLYRLETRQHGSIYQLPAGDPSAMVSWVCDQQILQMWPFRRRTGAWTADVLVYPFVEPGWKAKTLYRRRTRGRRADAGGV